MAERTWNEFLFGTKESREKSKKVLEEMRPDYERPGEKKAAPKKVTPSNPNRGLRQKGEAGLAPEKKAAPKPKLRPAPKTVEFKKKNLAANQAAGKSVSKKAEPLKKAAPKAAKKVAFRGNWVGAAPTEMQARGGARLRETAPQRMRRMMRERGVGSR